MDQAEKAHENRLRRKAARQGFKLHKSRRRDPDAAEFNTYRLARGAVVTRPLTLDEVEERLTSPRR